MREEIKREWRGKRKRESDEGRVKERVVREE